MESRQADKILIAGVGSDLRKDDGFGIEVIRKLYSETLPENITLLEVGIGGIHLVQELYSRYDVLVIVDAVEWGAEPGTIHYREAIVKDIDHLDKRNREAFLADMHYTNPVKAMMLAKKLDVLPERVLLLGCEAKEKEAFEMGLTPAVAQAVPEAVKWLLKFCHEPAFGASVFE